MRWNLRLRRKPLMLMLLTISAAFILGPGEARAQFGGFGYGGFMGGFNYVPSPTNFLNDHAMLNAARAGRPPSNNVYSGNPNSYVNRVRDNSFVPRYDVRRRPAGGSQVEMGTSLGQRPAPAPAPVTETAKAAEAVVRSVLPLASFFDGSRKLVWPADSPVDGDLKPKRDVSDQASAAVLKEVEQHGRAPIALAADARLKLLDYGRPALQVIRETSTPRIADAFHAFLRSLYDSLSATATMTTPEAPAPR